MNPFIVGIEYTHAAIVAAFGGEPVSYLPQVAGQIVCARFKSGDMNPNAPYDILVSALPRVEQKARLLASSGDTIPVFMKEGTNRWRYHGLMRCERFDVQVGRTDSVAPSAGRKTASLAGILRMVDVRTADPGTLQDTSRPRPAEKSLPVAQAFAPPPGDRAFAFGKLLGFTLVAAACVLMIGGAAAAGGFVGIAALLLSAIQPRRRSRRRRRTLF